MSSTAGTHNNVYAEVKKPIKIAESTNKDNLYAKVKKPNSDSKGKFVSRIAECSMSDRLTGTARSD